MRIQLKKNPVVCGGGSFEFHYRKRLEAIGGEWLEVETEHLFGDQFNCENENPDKHENGLRIYLSNVQDIYADVRPQAATCGYCGLCLHDVPDSDLLSDCPRCFDKAHDGVIGYVENPLCVIDRIRPLWAVLCGEAICIHNKRTRRKIKTPEGEVFTYGQPLKVKERTSYRGM